MNLVPLFPKPTTTCESKWRLYGGVIGQRWRSLPPTILMRRRRDGVEQGRGHDCKGSAGLLRHCVVGAVVGGDRCGQRRNGEVGERRERLKKEME